MPCLPSNLSRYLILLGCKTSTQDPLNAGAKRAVTQRGLKQNPCSSHCRQLKEIKERRAVALLREPRPREFPASAVTPSLWGSCGSWYLSFSRHHCLLVPLVEERLVCMVQLQTVVGANTRRCQSCPPYHNWCLQQAKPVIASALHLASPLAGMGSRPRAKGSLSG